MEAKQVSVIPEVRLPPDLPGPTMKKCSSSCKRKVVLTLLRKDEGASVQIWQPDDVLPKPARYICGKIYQNAQYPFGKNCKFEPDFI